MKAHLELTHISIEFPTPTGAFKALEKVSLNIEKVSLCHSSGTPAVANPPY